MPTTTGTYQSQDCLFLIFRDSQVFWAVLQPGFAHYVAVHSALHALLLPPLRAACDTTAGSDQGHSCQATNRGTGGNRREPGRWGTSCGG